MLTMHSIAIKPFQKQYQHSVEQLVLPIQQIEFGISITREDQPDLMDIAGTYLAGNSNFWVAVDGSQVVGTIGVIDISNRKAVLKKMFVAREYRGKDKGIAQLLMNTAIEWCKSKGIDQIFLGTTAQMNAAQCFYQKNNFAEIDAAELPPLFPRVSVDNKFYCRAVS